MTSDKMQPSKPLTYMEIYGSNNTLYRVTIGSTKRKDKYVSVYGVSVENRRTGRCECLENFSEDMEKTLKFTSSLVQKQISPSGLYNEALRHLRFSPDYIFNAK